MVSQSPTSNSNTIGEDPGNENSDKAIGFALTKPERQMLMELGMLAASNGLPWEAFRLFHDLMSADPDAAYPRIGLAYCNMMCGQFETAHKLLQQSQVVKSPLAGPAMALRMLAFQMAGCADACDKTAKELSKTQGGNKTIQNFVSALQNSKKK